MRRPPEQHGQSMPPIPPPAPYAQPSYVPYPTYPPQPPQYGQYPPGYAPPPSAKKRMTWPWQILGFVLGTGGALALGIVPCFFAVYATVGDVSPAPPGAERAQFWIYATYLLASATVGLLIVSIIRKKPWAMLVSAALTFVSFCIMVVMFARIGEA